MSAIGIIFWIWFTISLVVFVKRQVAKRQTPSSVVTPPAGQEPLPTTAEPEPVPPDSVDSVDSVDSDDRTTPPDGTEGARAVVRALLAEQGGPADAATAVPSQVAPRAADADDAASAAPRLTGVAAALDGIQLPCDLAPLTLGTDVLDPDHIELVTTGRPSQIVAAGLQEELERLDYEISDLGAGEYLATRGQTVIRVRIHDRPAVSLAEDGRGFSTADPDSLVVELALA